jgi:DNA-binding GntR family transcriptional regulator
VVNVRELSRSDTLDVTIADELRREIVERSLTSASPLRVRDLAARFGVSTTPVLAALKRLEVEGYVLVDARRGVRVAELSSEDLEELLVMRVAIEAFATNLAIPKADETVLKRMRRLLLHMEAMLDSGDSDQGELLELDRRFHMTLYGAAGRPSLLTKIGALRSRSEVYLFHDVADLDDHRRTSQAAHSRILEAAARGDLSASLELITSHILGTQARFDDPRSAAEVAT